MVDSHDDNALGKEDWQPDWRVPWNEILREWLAENGLTANDLAERLNMKWADAHRLCYDDVPMNARLADKLALFTGIKPDFWIRLDAIYRREEWQKSAT